MNDVFISRKQAAEALQAEHDQEVEAFGAEIPECFDAQLAIEILDSIPAADVISRDCFNRILAENDTMREQLAQIGKKPGDSMDDVKHVISFAEWIPEDPVVCLGGFAFY